VFVFSVYCSILTRITWDSHFYYKSFWRARVAGCMILWQYNTIFVYWKIDKPQFIGMVSQVLVFGKPFPIFTARRYASAIYAFLMCVSVCLCVSVTLRYCIKMAKRRITQIMPHDRPGTVVSIPILTSASRSLCHSRASCCTCHCGPRKIFFHVNGDQ